MQASFVIPTYNRVDHLRKSIHALLEQDFIKSEFEIVVVDDGSFDNTAETVLQLQQNSPVEIRYYKQQNRGQGVARNLGVKHACGKIIVFIGDDIICNKDFLKEHMRFHDKYRNENEAVLGLILWHPDLTVTPLMDFLTNGSVVFDRFGGQQFAYEKLKNKKMADFNFFYTSNISVKRSLLLSNPFDVAFSKYGWEDIELGYRLTKETNLKLYFNPNAVGYHLHNIPETDFENRMKMIGRSARVIDQKYPELRKVPPAWKRTAFMAISNPLSLMLMKKGSPIHYYALSKKYFLEGLKE